MFFEFATIAPDSALVGSFGNLIRNFNLKLFGYFSYIYPLLLIIPIFIAYRYFKKFDFRTFKFIFGFLLLFCSILFIQASIIPENGGIIGGFIVSMLKSTIGTLGVWIFNITFFILSLVLLFEDKFINMFKKWFIIKESEMQDNQNSNLQNFSNLKNDNMDFENVNLENNFQNESQKSSEFTNLQNFSNLEKTEQISNLQKSSPVITKPKKLKKAKQEDERLEFETNVEISNKPKIIKELAENRKLLDELDKGAVVKPKDFMLPSVDFLSLPPKKSVNIDESEIDQKIFNLLEKLRQFKIDGDVIRTYSGPIITTFEFRPAPNIKVSKILTLQDDLALALKVETIRIQAPIPGKDVVGIEIPNKNIDTIYLREILDSDIFKTASSPLTMALGKDIVGQPFVTDLKKLPHLLIAGTTGSGKSVGVNALILSLLYRNSPKTLRLVMVDPKMVEFSVYEDIPHLLTPIITEPKQAITALANLTVEMERRYKLMSANKTKTIESYNEKMQKSGEEIWPYIVVIIDEFADLIMTGGKDAEHYIALLAQKARACGIHLIIATQRPSREIVTGIIKSNMPSRISFKVRSSMDSRVILDQTGANSLLGRGDMLFTPPSGSGTIRLHAPFATEDEINAIADYLREQESVVYDERFITDTSLNSEGKGGEINIEGEVDELLEEAKNIIVTENKTSISYLQRRLRIGYNRASNIIETLEKIGFLSEPDAKGQREILR